MPFTIELLDNRELGLANGIRIGLYRVGMLASGFVLMTSDWLGWGGAYVLSAVVFFGLAAVSLVAPRERIVRMQRAPIASEIAALARSPFALAAIAGFAIGVVWLIDSTLKWSATRPLFWWYAIGLALLAVTLIALVGRTRDVESPTDETLTRGPMFGALMELLRRPAIVPVLAFILIFKLPDAAMGFMVKPFWVDVGFSAAEIGLVSVNIGLALSIAGGIAGGWITDRIGIFRALWVLGLAQAASNLGYWIAAGIIPPAMPGAIVPLEHKMILYAASATESFTGGLGTAAFLAFLMAIVEKHRAATEYALLSSVFALSRSVAGWVGGVGAQSMGYANWFLLTFFLAFPAYLLLPWVRAMLRRSEPRAARRAAEPG
jgi:PAT family beta-lactamase induction signal transducer AmpG